MDSNGNGQEQGMGVSPAHMINSLMTKVQQLTVENTMQAAYIQQMQEELAQMKGATDGNPVQAG